MKKPLTAQTPVFSSPLPVQPSIELKIVIPHNATHQRHIDRIVHAVARSVQLSVNSRAQVFHRRAPSNGWTRVTVPDHDNEGGMTD